MEGILANYRRGRHVQTNHHMVIYVDGLKNKDEAKKLIGKNISWKSPSGKEIKGKIASSHGNKGALRAIFEMGMPGQSLGTKVQIK